MKVGTLQLESKKFYHLTSVYFSLEKEPINDNNQTNCINNFEDEDYINLLSYELNGIHEINFFLDDKKFGEIFKRDIHNEKEFVFPKQFLITIHIHDMEILNERMDLMTYYVINFNIDKIIKAKNSEKFGLNFKVKTCDEKFIFSKATEEDICLNKLIAKNIPNSQIKNNIKKTLFN
jgi:hypothetical protein